LADDQVRLRSCQEIPFVPGWTTPAAPRVAKTLITRQLDKADRLEKE